MRSLLLIFALSLLQGQQPPAPASLEGYVVQLGTGLPVPGARVIIGVAQTTTDPNGRFEFRNLTPGKYPLAANHPDFMPLEPADRSHGSAVPTVTVAEGQKVTDIVLSLVLKGVISGRIFDRNDAPVKNATMQALKYTYQDGRRILIPVSTTLTNDLGEYRLLRLAPGPYIVRAVSSDSAVPEARLPVYFPGTIDAASASVVDLPPAVDFTGVDLRLSELRAVHVRRRVIIGDAGQPIFGGSLTLVPRRGTVATGTPQRATFSGTGSFEFRDMAPGSYEIVATANAASGRLAASASVEIGGRDIDEVTLVLQPQLSINGKISVENMQADSANMNLAGTRVELRREPFTSELLILLPNVAADGTFTLAGVTPGDYRLKVSTAGSKGYVKFARFGAADALNPPFRIDGPGQLDVVISLNAALVDAMVLDAGQKPVPAATAVLVPDAPYRQRLDLYYATGSDAAGHVHFDNVTPGDYRVFAWEDVPADAWQDPDFIRMHEHLGKSIHVTESSQRNIELRLVPR